MIYRPSITFFSREADRILSNALLEQIQSLCKQSKNMRPYKDALDLVLRNPIPYDIRGPIARLE